MCVQSCAERRAPAYGITAHVPWNQYLRNGLVSSKVFMIKPLLLCPSASEPGVLGAWSELLVYFVVFNAAICTHNVTSVTNYSD